MTPIEMISEWRKGCSCASKEHPAECVECTEALINHLEAVLIELPTQISSETIELLKYQGLSCVNPESKVTRYIRVAILRCANIAIKGLRPQE